MPSAGEPLPSGGGTPAAPGRPSAYGKNVRNARELAADGGGGGDDGGGDEGGGDEGGGEDVDDVGVTSMSIQRFSPPSWVSHAFGIREARTHVVTTVPARRGERLRIGR